MKKANKIIIELLTIVIAVLLVFSLTPSMVAGNEEHEVPWGVERIEADCLHESATGDGVGVAVLDAGIDDNHDDLEDNIVESYDFYNDNEDTDDSEHGTHVAGILGANSGEGILGTAPNIDIYDYQVAEQDDGDSDVKDKAVDEALEKEVVDNPDIQIVLMSISWSQSPAREELLEDLASDDWGDCLYENILVSSAGNTYIDHVTFPASHEDVIAVSATDEDDDLWEGSGFGDEIDFAAPGVDIYSTEPDNDYGDGIGTSMAAPHVAGAAALLLDMGADISEVEDYLTDGAEDIGLDPEEQGEGLVNPYQAVNELEISTSGSGWTDPSTGTNHYPEGEEVDISAHASQGWEFKEWTGDIEAIENPTSSNTQITIEDDYEITAEFEEIYDTCPICGGHLGHCDCGITSHEHEACLERSEYEEYLEEGQIAPELLEALREEGIDDLDREAELSQAEEGWLIQQDSEKRYWIEVTEKELRVYDIENI